MAQYKILIILVHMHVSKDYILLYIRGDKASWNTLTDLPPKLTDCFLALLSSAPERQMRKVFQLDPIPPTCVPWHTPALSCPIFVMLDRIIKMTNLCNFVRSRSKFQTPYTR